MTPQTFLDILKVAEKLKCNTRHNYTTNGRKESVADHSWRLGLMAMLLSSEEEFQKLDMDKVIRMCLIHDLGEAFTGDIPVFNKTDTDTEKEDQLYREWVDTFPEPQRGTFHQLLDEMDALETPEAKTYKALDKLEALIAHDEADINTWLPLEYELQLTYGQENMTFSPYMIELRNCVDAWTRDKIANRADKEAVTGTQS